MEREGRLPDFVLVAANRCGSTALSADLRAHPEIFMPKRKEIHFFDREFGRGESWYRAHFRDVGDASVVGEKTPGYMYRADAVDRMATLLPNARLLAIIRNPVDRAYSNYSKNRAMYRETLPFRQAIAAEPDRLAEGRLSFAYLDRGRYLHQFERLCERYPREQLHVVIAEEYWSDRGKNYRDILGFLGVGPDFRPPTPGRIRGSFQAYRSKTVFRIARKLPRFLATPLQRLNEVPGRYPPMDPALRAELLELFREDNRSLASWLGKDLSRWER